MTYNASQHGGPYRTWTYDLLELHSRYVIGICTLPVPYSTRRSTNWAIHPCALRWGLERLIYFKNENKNPIKTSPSRAYVSIRRVYMVSHFQFLAVVHGVRAALIVWDTFKPVALFACGLIDHPLKSSVHERSLPGEQSTWIPSISIAEVSDRGQLAHITQSK